MTTLLDNFGFFQHYDHICKAVSSSPMQIQCRRVSPASTTVRKWCAMKMLVQALSSGVALTFFMCSELPTLSARPVQRSMLQSASSIRAPEQAHLPPRQRTKSVDPSACHRESLLPASGNRK